MYPGPQGFPCPNPPVGGCASSTPQSAPKESRYYLVTRGLMLRSLVVLNPAGPQSTAGRVTLCSLAFTGTTPTPVLQFTGNGALLLELVPDAKVSQPEGVRLAGYCESIDHVRRRVGPLCPDY